jgi:hypothetical protein
MKSNRSRGKRDVVHPLFLACKEHCPNEYWKGVFDDIAYGKYPKQIYVSGGMIQSSNKRKLSFCYSLKDKTPTVLVRDVIELLSNHTDLISNDEIKKKKDSNEQYKKDIWFQWKDIKRKHIKDILLMDYCMDLRKEYGWTMKKTSSVYQALTLRIYGGQLTEIRMHDQKILSIVGMEITEEGEVVFDKENEFRAEQIYPMEDYVYHYCKRYISKNSKAQPE